MKKHDQNRVSINSKIKTRNRYFIICQYCGKKSKGKIGQLKKQKGLLVSPLSLCEQCANFIMNTLPIPVLEEVGTDSTHDKNGQKFYIFLEGTVPIMERIEELKEALAQWDEN